MDVVGCDRELDRGFGLCHVGVAHTVRSAVQFDAETGDSIDALVDRIYERGDAADIRISYRKPELYGHLYHELEAVMENGHLQQDVSVGITAEGRITAFPRATDETNSP